MVYNESCFCTIDGYIATVNWESFSVKVLRSLHLQNINLVVNVIHTNFSHKLSFPIKDINGTHYNG